MTFPLRGALGLTTAAAAAACCWLSIAHGPLLLHFQSDAEEDKRLNRRAATEQGQLAYRESRIEALSEQLRADQRVAEERQQLMRLAGGSSVDLDNAARAREASFQAQIDSARRLADDVRAKLSQIEVQRQALRVQANSRAIRVESVSLIVIAATGLLAALLPNRKQGPTPTRIQV